MKFEFLNKFLNRAMRSTSHSHEVKTWIVNDGGLHGINDNLRALFSHPNGLTALNDMKAKRQPLIDVDYVRALHFWKLGQMSSMHESLKEELRYFPDNPRAQKLQQRMSGLKNDHIYKNTNLRYKEIFQIISPYTMMGGARLENIYEQTASLCRRGIAGHFVECGVAAGGSSALLAAVIKDYGQQSRRVFAFDTFEGMPAPSVEDTHKGVQAQETGWGAGTCSAPQKSLLEVGEKLEVVHLITPVKGLFAETLPQWVDLIGPIAFLHVDGDWYSSTKDVLDKLFDSVVSGGVIQFDDYGYWDGCKKAVHEFMESRRLDPVFHKIDTTGVWMVKS